MAGGGQDGEAEDRGRLRAQNRGTKRDGRGDGDQRRQLLGREVPFRTDEKTVVPFRKFVCAVRKRRPQRGRRRFGQRTHEYAAARLHLNQRFREINRRQNLRQPCGIRLAGSILGNAPPTFRLGGTFRRRQAHDTPRRKDRYDARHAQLDGLLDRPVPSTTLRDTREERQAHGRWRHGTRLANGLQSIGGTGVCPHSALSIEQFNLFARFRTQHLEMARGGGRQDRPRAGKGFRWN